MSKELHLEVRAGVAWLTVDRPEVRNALSAALCREIADRLNELALDAAVRVVVFRGAGEKVFVSGADINEFTESLASPQSALDYDANAELMQTAIRKLPKPVIAMIQGYAVGSGCIVAVACDFRIASTAARFGIPVAKFGFVAPVPDVLRLAHLVGPAKAKWIMMTGKLLDAKRALEIGLVDEVVEPAQLQEATEAFARVLADNAPLTHKVTKEIIEEYTAPSNDVYAGRKWYEEVFSSGDFREGLDAFFAKRKPDFKGK